MVIYDKAYIEMRNKYILPLSNYGIVYNSLRSNSMKETIVSKFISVELRNGKDLFFSLEEDVLFKGLLGDIQLFYLRYLIQHRDVNKIENILISPNWNIVTHYYEAFFAASLLLRIMFRGNIYLENSLKKKLEELVSYNLGYAVSIDKSQFFEVIKDNDGYSLKLQRANPNTHELVWEKMDSVINEMLLNSRDKSDEKSILMALKKINNQLTKTYPSQIRNKVNYQPLYGLETVERKLYSINPQLAWTDFLLKNGDISWDDDNSVVNALFCYAQYIKLLSSNLITEYFQIKGNMNGVQRKFNEFSGETRIESNVIYSV